MADGSKNSPRPTVKLAVIIVFSALITLGTVLSLKLPQPLYEVTFAPPIYFALAMMTDPLTAFSATALGSFLGEWVNITYISPGPPIYAVAMIWARGPEALMVSWARKRSRKTLVWVMVGATVFETAGFFFPDWLFYTYGLFSYGAPTSAASALVASLSDLGTMVDLVFIPLAFIIADRARASFGRLGFN
jgi:hypothetical protein